MQSHVLAQGAAPPAPPAPTPVRGQGCASPWDRPSRGQPAPSKKPVFGEHQRSAVVTAPGQPVLAHPEHSDVELRAQRPGMGRHSQSGAGNPPQVSGGGT